VKIIIVLIFRLTIKFLKIQDKSQVNKSQEHVKAYMLSHAIGVGRSTVTRGSSATIDSSIIEGNDKEILLSIGNISSWSRETVIYR
jgi:hypothetical protein